MFEGAPDHEGLVGCPHCGLWHRPASRPSLCIGTGRGNRGLVYGEDGTVIGRVFKQARRLRNNGGQFGEAWTAHAIIDGQDARGSLGTRHPDRWHAARAILAFHRKYTPARIRAMAMPWDRRPEAAASRAVSYFKYDHHETCGLTARYRGEDPRAHDRDAADRMRATDTSYPSV